MQEENACRERRGKPGRTFDSECTFDRLTEDAGSSSFFTGGSEAAQCKGEERSLSTAYGVPTRASLLSPWAPKEEKRAQHLSFPFVKAKADCPITKGR